MSNSPRSRSAWRVVRVEDPVPALELVRPNGSGWFLLRLPAGRYRLGRRDWPRRGLYVADTPRPDCPDCCGEGGWSQDYADESGEYGGTHECLCPCWDVDLAVLVLPLPRRSWRRRAAADPWHSNQSPF